MDFATPRNSTFVGPISIPGVAAFTAPCLTTQDCIPQPATATKLDALGDRLMYRLAYRNLGDHESIVANHTVVAGSGATGIRWYEVRIPMALPQSISRERLRPDADNRWMGSIAMDQQATSGSVTASPAASRFLPFDLPDGKSVTRSVSCRTRRSLVTAGVRKQGITAGAITPRCESTRAMTVRFWYTQEYQATTQTAGWNTRIGSFRFPSCGQSLTPTTTTIASSMPTSQYLQPVTFTATVSPSVANGTCSSLTAALLSAPSP